MTGETIKYERSIVKDILSEAHQIRQKSRAPREINVELEGN